MKLIINNEEKGIELDGVIKNINNKFYGEIRATNEIKLITLR